MIQVGKKFGNQPLDDHIMEHVRMKRITPEDAYDKALDKKNSARCWPIRPDETTTLDLCAARTGPDLTTMLASQPEVSDLLFTVDRPPQVESYGELKPVTLDPPIEKLTPFQTR
jgi:hypothetical protein